MERIFGIKSAPRRRRAAGNFHSFRNSRGQRSLTPWIEKNKPGKPKFKQEELRVFGVAVDVKKVEGQENYLIGHQEQQVWKVGTQPPPRDLSPFLESVSKLQIIDLSDNKISYKGVVHHFRSYLMNFQGFLAGLEFLTNILHLLNSLRQLDLSSNTRIGDFGAVSLAKCLSLQHTRLQTLLLRSCGIEQNVSIPRC